jgi:DNA topoisomerase II
MYIVDLEKDMIMEKTITYTPGLFKIFDEILVNAADNKQRDGSMDRLEIEIDANQNKISVKNNGAGIPVVWHKDSEKYVPSMVFGQLLTGSNYRDNEKKTTGGRNGYGAKLANVFSTKFMIECVDTKNKKKLKQTFRSNMDEAAYEEPTISDCTKSDLKEGDSVKVTFYPDLHRFGMEQLDDATVALLSKRAYDIAGTMGQANGKKLIVYLNGKKLGVKNFKDYLTKYQNVEEPEVYSSNERWEIAIGASTEGAFQQVSFVNSIATTKGGKHVDYISDQVVDHLLPILKKKSPSLNKNIIQMNLSVSINCLIENPAFDSQTKTNMVTQAKNFGSTFEIPKDMLKKVQKGELAKKIIEFAEFKSRQAMRNKGGSKKKTMKGIPKLDDANHAGTAKSKDCTLIITEGDSAKSLAMAGLSIVGRDYYGVFPLRGKVLNVREKARKEVTSNEEIKNLVDILGLKYEQGKTILATKYPLATFGVDSLLQFSFLISVYDDENIKTLRYGHLMIMADQDTDGSHIKYVSECLSNSRPHSHFSDMPRN